MEVSGQLHAPALYPQGKKPWYQLDRRLGGPQSQSGSSGEEKNSQPLPGFKPPIIQPVAQRCNTELCIIVMNPEGLVCEGVDWFQLDQDRVQWRTFVKKVMKFQIPEMVGNLLISWTCISFSKTSLLLGISYFYTKMDFFAFYIASLKLFHQYLFLLFY
jgi:hypothetical protein